MGIHIYKRCDGGVLKVTLPTYDLSAIGSADARELLLSHFRRLDSQVLSSARRMADEGGVRRIDCTAEVTLVADTLRVVRSYEIDGDTPRKYTATDDFKLFSDGGIKAIKYSKIQRLFHHGTHKNGSFGRKPAKKRRDNITK